MTTISRFLDELESKTVTIIVGQGEHTGQYQLSSGTLRSASKWFDKALQDNRFQEGRTSTITLPEDSPEAFNVFVYYAYHGDICYEMDPRTLEARSDELKILCQAYTFSDKYLLAPLQNCAMHRICALLHDDWLGTSLASRTLAFCWHVLNDGSPVRLALADYIVQRMDHDKVFDMPECPGLIQELHKSWEAFHNSGSDRSDFPRFMKPRKFAKLLYIYDEEDDRRSELGWSQCDWNTSDEKCDECGYPAELIQFCVTCNGTDCQCVWEKGTKRLCEYCEPFKD